MAYLKKLKQMEIYDSSLIILQGDHGSNIKPLINGVEIDLEVKRAAALLTIKRPGDQAVFKLSTAKTTLTDIPATVMDILKMEHQFGGYSVFKLDETKDRKREFGICYEPHTKLTKYLVDGSIFDPTKWKKLGVYEVNTENIVPVQRKVDKFKK